jgi:RNA polymerase sigma-B factor
MEPKSGLRASEQVTWGPREQRLLARARNERDARAMDELFRLMLPLARRLARKYQRSREPLDDLFQVASLGLYRALQRFDPDRGVEFPVFAIPTIIGELKRYRRDFAWSVHVPRSLQERALAVRRELNQLSSELGHHPTPGELAARCDLPVEEVIEACVAADARFAASLDHEQRVDPLPIAAGEDPGFGRVEGRDVVGRAMRALPAREKRILALRFGQDLTQHEIAQDVGISQMQVHRLLTRALERVGIVLAHAY